MKRAIRDTLERTGWIDLRYFPADHRWNLCSERLRTGDFSNWDGWEFRSDWSMTYWWGKEIKIPIPKLDLRKSYQSPIKHIVVLGEQGLGDEICYSSVLPELITRAGHDAIEFQCYPKLKPVFERSFRIKCTDRLPLSEVKHGEAVIALGDLLPLYRKAKEHFPRRPFLRPDPALAEHWKCWLRGFTRPWVGFAYKSRHGSFDRAKFLSAMTSGARFDLQYGSQSRDSPPFDVSNDFENLFAFISCLDRVESCTQTLCHIAGSLGKECHAVIPPKNGETISKLWYYSEGKSFPPGFDGYWESPIYPNFTVYKNIDEFRNCSTRRIERPLSVNTGGLVGHRRKDAICDPDPHQTYQ